MQAYRFVELFKVIEEASSELSSLDQSINDYFDPSNVEK